MIIQYKRNKSDQASRLTDKREILYRFSEIFPNDIDKKDQEDANINNVQSLLDLIENEWMPRSDLFGSMNLPSKNDLVDILTQLREIFKDISVTEKQCFPDSFYHFITNVFQSYDDDLMLNLLINVILLSNCEFNNILIPFLDNFQLFLQSTEQSNQIDYIEMCNNFISDNTVFNILYENQIHLEIFKVINTSGNIDIINCSFEFLCCFFKQYRCFNESYAEDDDLYVILENTLLFIKTTERDELLSMPFLLLDAILNDENPAFLEYAKELGLIDIFAGLFQKENPVVFIASTRLLNGFWSDCSLFDNNQLYERFKNIIEEQNSNYKIKYLLTFFNIVLDTNQEDIQIIAIDVLCKLIPNHYEQFNRYKIAELLLYQTQEMSFQLKLPVLQLFLDYLTFSPVEARRSSMCSNVSTNSINLIIDAIESENCRFVYIIVVTLIKMIDDDSEFWIDLISSTDIINSLKSVYENSEETMQTLIYPLLEHYYSHISE